MKLILQRHTAVDAPIGLCYGQMDVAPADTFEAEKALVLEQLKPFSFDKIFSSPLRRCKLLAEAIADNSVKVVYDERLKELHFGNWEGMLWQEIEQSPEAQFWFSDYVNHPCPNGESFIMLIDRCRDFIDELRQHNSCNTILIVCHSGIIKAFQTIIHNQDPLKSFNQHAAFGEFLEFELYG